MTIDTTHCPVCGSSRIGLTSIEADGPDAWTNVECDDCMSTWQEVFRISHITITLNTKKELEARK